MSCYFIAQIRIHDEATYQKYLDRVDEVFAPFNGRYLSVDKAPVVLEGNWDYSRTVLIRFESRADFEAWYHSPGYREILKYRLQAADCTTILINGND